MITKHILVTGLPATGKSYLAKFFKKMGKNAYDADDVIGRWVDKKTGKPREPTKREWEQLSGIEWEWDSKKLKSILKQNKEAYLFGSANNIHELAHLFDKTYYLRADKELILKRIRNKDREHDFGRPVKQRKLILSWIKPVEERAKKAGFKFIDASLTPEEIFNIIAKKSPKRLKE